MSNTLHTLPSMTSFINVSMKVRHCKSFFTFFISSTNIIIPPILAVLIHCLLYRVLFRGCKLDIVYSLLWMMKKEFLPSCGSLLLMVVLVTGAAHRIGREISLTLAKQGHSIALHYKQSKESASQLAEQINSLKKGKAYIYHADLSDSLSLRKLIHDVAKMGTIDHIVNNASSYEHDTISTVTPESFDKMISVNLKAPLFLSKEFIAYRENLAQSSMSQPRMSCTSIFPSNMVMYPSITNILDQKIACTNADNLSYTIAKHGLHSLTEMLAKESAPMIRGMFSPLL